MATTIRGFDDSQYARIAAMLHAFESGTLWPSEKVRTPAPKKQLAVIPFYNDSGETIPAWGVMRITAATVDSDGAWRLTCGKPNTTFYNTYLVNSGYDVPASEDWWGTYLWHSGYVLCDSTYTPTAGQEWGPTSGSWSLVRHRPGFLIDGGPTGSGAVYRAVAKQRIIADLFGKADADIAQGSTGTVSVWTRNASTGTYEDSTYNVTAFAIGGAITSALFCSLRFDCGQWSAACLEQ